MITIRKQAGNEIIRTAILERDSWLHVIAPDRLEIESLEREYGIPVDVIQDVLDPNERSRHEREDGLTILIVRVPIPTFENEDTPFTTIPLGIILTDSLVITVCAREPEFLQEVADGRVRGIRLSDRHRFVLTLFNRFTNRFLRYLKEIHQQTGVLEQKLQRSVRNTQLVRLLAMEKSLVYFTTSLKGNELLMDKLVRIMFKDLSEEDQDLLDDVLIDTKQAIEMANIYSNILSGMMDAFASVISNNLNTVMKRLTMISIILMIPTLFASIYGMNIGLPFQHSPMAFAGVMGVSVVVALLGSLGFLAANSVK